MSGVEVPKLVTLVLVDVFREILDHQPGKETLMWLRGRLDPAVGHEWLECEAIGQLRRDCNQLLADWYGAPGEDLA